VTTALPSLVELGEVELEEEELEDDVDDALFVCIDSSQAPLGITRESWSRRPSQATLREAAVVTAAR
jgi:hypothetical protein